MPLGIDTDQTFPVYLPSDANKPADKRPTFHCRFRTPRQIRRMREQMAEVAKAANEWTENAPKEKEGETDDERAARVVATINRQAACSEKAASLCAKLILGVVAKADNFIDEEGKPAALDEDNLTGILHTQELASLAWSCIDGQAPAIHDFFSCASASTSANSAGAADATATGDTQPTTPAK